MSENDKGRAHEYDEEEIEGCVNWDADGAHFRASKVRKGASRLRKSAIRNSLHRGVCGVPAKLDPGDIFRQITMNLFLRMYGCRGIGSMRPTEERRAAPLEDEPTGFLAPQYQKEDAFCIIDLPLSGPHHM